MPATATKTKRKPRKRKTYTPEQIAEFRRRDAELMAETDAAVADPDTVADVVAWLITQARPSITRLSLRNQTQLYKQGVARGAVPTDVRTPGQWRQAGRAVVEYGAHFHVTVPRGAEPGETDGEPDGDEGQATEHDQADGDAAPARTRFRTRRYYDVTATAGVDDDADAITSAALVADPGNPPADPAAALWDRLAEQVADAGYELTEGTENGTDHDALTITIARDGVPAAVAAAALGVQLAAVITHQRVTGHRPAQPAVPDGVQRVTLELGEGFGTAVVDVRTDWDTGATLYTLIKAARMSGAITLTPQTRPDDGDVRSTAVDVDLGDATGPRHLHWSSDEDRRRTGLALHANGIELAGGLIGQTHESVTRRMAYGGGPVVWNLHRYERFNGSRRAPDATQARASALIRAAVLHWYARPDLAEVQEVVARRMAPTLGAELDREAVRLAKHIAELEQQRADATAKAARFAAILTPAAEPVTAPATPTASEPTTPASPVVDAHQPAEPAAGHRVDVLDLIHDPHDVDAAVRVAGPHLEPAPGEALVTLWCYDAATAFYVPARRVPRGWVFRGAVARVAVALLNRAHHDGLTPMHAKWAGNTVMWVWSESTERMRPDARGTYRLGATHGTWWEKPAEPAPAPDTAEADERQAHDEPPASAAIEAPTATAPADPDPAPTPDPARAPRTAIEHQAAVPEPAPVIEPTAESRADSDNEVLTLF